MSTFKGGRSRTGSDEADLVSQPLPRELRRREILAKVRRNGGASVSELAREHSVSPVTIHRDLEVLANDGLVGRIHGGARAVDSTVPHVETDFMKRVRQNPAGKYMIAAHALKEIGDGATIFIDHSTSCLALARQVEQHPPKALTIVTNSPAIGFQLHENAIHLVVTPGEVDQTMRLISGGWTEEFISRLHFQMAFVSSAGLSLERGLTTTRQSLAGTLRAARAVSEWTVALIDSTKVARDSLLTIFRAQELDEIITDEGAAKEMVDTYRAAGVNMVVAESSAVPD
jgi:DeoR family fructose operon transcriptional repressor